MHYLFYDLVTGPVHLHIGSHAILCSNTSYPISIRKIYQLHLQNIPRTQLLSSRSANHHLGLRHGHYLFVLLRQSPNWRSMFLWRTLMNILPYRGDLHKGLSPASGPENALNTHKLLTKSIALESNSHKSVLALLCPIIYHLL